MRGRRGGAVRADGFGLVFVLERPSGWIGDESEDALRRRSHRNRHGRHEAQVLAENAVDGLVAEVGGAGGHPARAAQTRKDGGAQHRFASAASVAAAGTES